MCIGAMPPVKHFVTENLKGVELETANSVTHSQQTVFLVISHQLLLLLFDFLTFLSVWAMNKTT